MVFKQCSGGTKGTEVCQENIIHTITPPPVWTDDRRKDGMYVFMIFAPNSDPTVIADVPSSHQVTVTLTSAWSSLAILPQPLAPTRHFHSENYPHWRFSLFWPILCRWMCGENLSRSAVTEILKSACRASTTMLCSKSLKSLLFSILMLCLVSLLRWCVIIIKSWKSHIIFNEVQMVVIRLYLCQQLLLFGQKVDPVADTGVRLGTLTQQIFKWTYWYQKSHVKLAG